MSWSWGDDQRVSNTSTSRRASLGKEKVANIATDGPGESSSNGKTHLPRPVLRSVKSTKRSVKLQSALSTQAPSTDEPIVNDEVTRYRRATDPEPRAPAGDPFKTSPQGFSPQSSGIGKQTRRRLLGNRKVSNLPVEEEHFKTHRDSLTLTHERLSADEESTAEEETQPSAINRGKEKLHGRALESLKRKTWSRSHPPECSHKQAQAPVAEITSDARQFSVPINQVATKIRSPFRPEKKDEWLRLSEDGHPQASSASNPPRPSSLKRHPSPWPDDMGTKTVEHFLKLSPTHHEPAPMVVFKQNQRDLQHIDSTLSEELAGLKKHAERPQSVKEGRSSATRPPRRAGSHSA